MKKIMSLLMIVAITLVMTAPAMANPVITVLVDGKKIEFDAQPEMVNERTMVPMRAIFEELGAVVSWDQSTQTVLAETAIKTVTATIGETSMYVDGEEKVMDVAPYVKDDRTYVPARFIAEALDCEVDWDQATHTVIIKSGADEEFLYTYNMLKDFAVTYGEFDGVSEWTYYEEIDETLICIIYDGTLVEVIVNETYEDWDMYSAVAAARCGLGQVYSTVISPEGESSLSIFFHDGRSEVIEESYAGVDENTMYEIINACIEYIDAIAVLLDSNCSVSDFGITKVYY